MGWIGVNIVKNIREEKSGCDWIGLDLIRSYQSEHIRVDWFISNRSDCSNGIRSNREKRIREIIVEWREYIRVEQRRS